MSKQKNSTNSKQKKVETKQCSKCDKDIKDNQMYKCACNYIICLECYEDIKKKEKYCPNCQRDYPPKIYNQAEQKKQTNVDNTEKKRASGKGGKSTSSTNTNNKSGSDLSKVRVIKKNLVYVIGLAPEIANEQTLQKVEYFGQYGKITKCVVNKNNAYNPTGPNGPSYSAYITYQSEKEASFAILAVDDFTIQGRTIRASYGTTKYCQYFLKDQQCPNISECLYLHEYGKEIETFSKDDITSNKYVFKDSQQLAVQNIKKFISELIKLKIKKDKTNCQSTLPHPSDIIKKLVQQSIYKQSEIDELVKTQESQTKSSNPTLNKQKSPQVSSSQNTQQKATTTKQTQIIDQWQKEPTIITTINISQNESNKSNDVEKSKQNTKKQTSQIKPSARLSDTNSEDVDNGNNKSGNQKIESRRSENSYENQAGKQSDGQQKQTKSYIKNYQHPNKNSSKSNDKNKFYKGQKDKNQIDDEQDNQEYDDTYDNENNYHAVTQYKYIRYSEENQRHFDNNESKQDDDDNNTEQQEYEEQDEHDGDEGDEGEDHIEEKQYNNSKQIENEKNKEKIDILSNNNSINSSLINSVNMVSNSSNSHLNQNAFNSNNNASNEKNQTEQAILTKENTNNTLEKQIVNNLMHGIQRNQFFQKRFPVNQKVNVEKPVNLVSNTISDIMKCN